MRYVLYVMLDCLQTRRASWIRRRLGGWERYGIIAVGVEWSGVAESAVKIKFASQREWCLSHRDMVNFRVNRWNSSDALVFLGQLFGNQGWHIVKGSP